jgi:hypothetical protein
LFPAKSGGLNLSFFSRQGCVKKMRIEYQRLSTESRYVARKSFPEDSGAGGIFFGRDNGLAQFLGTVLLWQA